ncbi:hypothetical protein SAMN05192545_2875 [Maribacter dokdonensis]|uniref:Uncharacterized protein n=1 Tax=Maribacter dokdonensis TaxID=320912 RepID=A0ABY0UT82_9FLAO|nr:hypothetical protein [Maribacter dokdonensis]SDT14805.1 hypothetical protein SAMN05192545_2875 [Maribacter dokdonensis]
MSTATAYAVRPLVMLPKKVELELVKALPEDLKTFSKHDENGDPIYVLRKGMVYWLYSPSTNQIKPTPYTVDDNTDVHELAEYLAMDMVYVARSPFYN